MTSPTIRSGKFSAGSDLRCGTNVVVEVAEEVVVGDRVVLPDNAYFGGRRVTLGDDFYGYSWEWRRLDIGRGRIDEEHALLTVGSRCTFHDNRIDLAREVMIGDDVGFSPEVAMYTHGYWQSVLEGFPVKFAPVVVGDATVIGFRSVLLPGANVGHKCVVGAQSVVAGKLEPWGVYAGNPARLVREVERPFQTERELLVSNLLADYGRSCKYRGLGVNWLVDFPNVFLARCYFNVLTLTTEGEEDEVTDDFRTFLFKRGIRLYTKRPFRKLGRVT